MSYQQLNGFSPFPSLQVQPFLNPSRFFSSFQCISDQPSWMAQFSQYQQISQYQEFQTQNTGPIIKLEDEQNKQYHEKYQYLFNIHLELYSLKTNNIYRDLMNNREIKVKGGRLFRNKDDFLQKNLYSIYNEQFASKLIKATEEKNLSKRQDIVIELLKEKLNEQQQISKKKIRKNKTTKKLKGISEEIVKNLQAIIDK